MNLLSVKERVKEKNNKLDFAFSQKNSLQEAANKILPSYWVLSKMLRYQPL